MFTLDGERCGVSLLLAFDVNRNDGVENRYSILISFDSQESTDTFYQHFRGKQFNSLEVWFCFVSGVFVH